MAFSVNGSGPNSHFAIAMRVRVADSSKTADEMSGVLTATDRQRDHPDDLRGGGTGSLRAPNTSSARGNLKALGQRASRAPGEWDILSGSLRATVTNGPTIATRDLLLIGSGIFVGGLAGIWQLWL